MVVTTELATMNMMQLKYVPATNTIISHGESDGGHIFYAPMRGELFVTGSISPTIVLNKTIANNRLTPATQKLISR